MDLERHANVLAEFILRDRKVTAKGQVAQAYQDVLTSLRALGKTAERDACRETLSNRLGQLERQVSELRERIEAPATDRAQEVLDRVRERHLAEARYHLAYVLALIGPGLQVTDPSLRVAAAAEWLGGWDVVQEMADEQ